MKLKTNQKADAYRKVKCWLIPVISKQVKSK